MIRLQYSFAHLGYLAYMVKDGKTVEAEIVTKDSGNPYPGHFAIFSDDQAQALMEDLWKEGVRPKSVGSVGELDATKRHLEDMRTLVFKTSKETAV